MRESFDYDWLFHRGDIPGAQSPEFDDSGWKRLDLPHDYAIAGPIAEGNPSGPGGGFFPGEIGWYRKRFAWQPSAASPTAAIEFDGVYWNSEVWINGYRLGKRPNGYIGFRYDLTPYLLEGGGNVLAVRVDNSEQPNSRWYSGSGIYRHVWLWRQSPVRVAHWGVSVSTPSVKAKRAMVEARVEIENAGGADRAAELRLAVLDPDGFPAAESLSLPVVPAGATVEAAVSMAVAKPRLWSPDSPSLYTLRAIVSADGQTLDEIDTPFGIRFYEFDADRGFSLNGQSMKLQGVCLHHDGGCVGSAVPERVWERRLETLKAAGCNAIRLTHNPPAPEVMDMLDRMGFLAIGEIFDEWLKKKREFSYGRFFADWWLRDLTDQIRRDRNHPCVILWSIGNEIHERATPEGAALARELAAACHAADPTRPVTSGVNNIDVANRTGFAQALDVVGYNGGGGSVFMYLQDHEAYPDRRMYASEVPHSFSTRGVYRTHSRHRNESGMEWVKMRTQEVPPLTEREVFGWFHDSYHSSYDNAYVRICARDSWRLIEDFDFMAGEFRWIGIDYLGESHGWPAKSSNAGIVDLAGFPKETYYFYQSRWSRRPMLHILPHWTWPELAEGTIVPVWAYTTCDSVELFLNGESLGEQRRGKRFHLSWDVPYRLGAIKAIGRTDGGIVLEEQHCTAGPAAALELSLDRSEIAADGRDVAHLIVRVLDAEGRFQPRAADRIRFQVEGAGRLIGVENGDPIDRDSYKADNRRAFGGLCLGIAQSIRGESGAIRVAVSADGLKGASAEALALR